MCPVRQAVETFLWERQRFRLPRFGRSNVPAHSTVDHPGIYAGSVRLVKSHPLESQVHKQSLEHTRRHFMI